MAADNRSNPLGLPDKNPDGLAVLQTGLHRPDQSTLITTAPTDFRNAPNKLLDRTEKPSRTSPAGRPVSR